MKIAVSQYTMELSPNWKAYTSKIEYLVKEAKQQGAELLLLPEYAGIEIACQYYPSDNALYQVIQPLIPKYLEFYQQLSSHYQMYIQPGTIMVEVKPGRYANRAYFFSPNGNMGYQDKLKLVEFEKNTKVFIPGETQTLFQTSFGLIGISVCYDSEFPEIVRQLTYAGALLVLVPSYTTSTAGYHRVFISCRARALENQCYVAMSSMVGPVELSGEKEQAIGHSAIVGPVDNSFPDDGVLIKATAQDKIIVTELNPEKLVQVRAQGQVHNFEDSKLS